MPKIRVQRTSEFENRGRKIKLEIDGEVVAQIKNGEELEIEVSEGQHTIQAKIDWCSSNLVEFKVDNETSTVLRLESGDGFSLFRIFFKTNTYLKLTKIS